jgi:hypothetical protein
MLNEAVRTAPSGQLACITVQLKKIVVQMRDMMRAMCVRELGK